MSLTEYQNALRVCLEQKLHSGTVCEWKTQMNAHTYSPRLDIAVGPFSLVDGVRLTQEYNELFQNNAEFIKQLIKIHLKNLGYITVDTSNDEIAERVQTKFEELYYFNFNARCFMAIEIENAVTRKHLMGGAINASVLGRIAVAVGYTAEMHNAFLNLHRYFSYLQSVDKPTFKTNNLLVISADQLMEICIEE